MNAAKPTYSVGRTTHVLADTQRDDRMFSVEVWFPQREISGDLKLYELLPGVGFHGSSRDGGSSLEGLLPWIIVSHGHMGTRLVYSQLCEAFAAMGYVVMALDHPGDTLLDVVSGTGVDEEANIALRLGDLEFLYRHATGEREGFNHGLSLDLSNLTLLGHSFGAYSVMAWAGTETGLSAARSVVCLEPYLLQLTPEEISRVTTPVLVVAGSQDATTPVETNVTPVLPHLTAPTTAVVLEGVGHQGCSDVAWYIEAAPTIPGVPDFVVEFLNTMSADTTGKPGEPWRPVRDAHIDLVSTWLASDRNDAHVVARAAAHRGSRITA